MFKSFREFIVESNETTIYHGDNFDTVSLDPKLMNNGNNQEGVGIYFSNDISTAKTYGRNIVEAKINVKNFISSRDDVSKLGRLAVLNVLKDMLRIDKENFFYLATDYGIEISDESELKDIHVTKLYSFVREDEVRNWQVDMSGRFGVVEFVKSWNSHMKFDGTSYHTGLDTWFAVINTKISVQKII